jgi:hypothetical protein
VGHSWLKVIVNKIARGDFVYLYNILGGRPFHPFVPSSVLSPIHPSSSSWKKKMMEEEEDEWQEQQFIQMKKSF